MQGNLITNENYKDTGTRMNTLGTFNDKIHIWMAIRQANADWSKTVRNSDTRAFIKWMAETWGIQLYFQENSLSTKFDVIDQSAYTMFLLKYDK
jgi:hypothetical protein